MKGCENSRQGAGTHRDKLSSLGVVMAWQVNPVHVG